MESAKGGSLGPLRLIASRIGDRCHLISDRNLPVSSVPEFQSSRFNPPFHGSNTLNSNSFTMWKSGKLERKIPFPLAKFDS